MAKAIRTPPVDKLVDETVETVAAGAIENPVETVVRAAEKWESHYSLKRRHRQRREGRPVENPQKTVRSGTLTERTFILIDFI